MVCSAVSVGFGQLLSNQPTNFFASFLLTFGRYGVVQNFGGSLYLAFLKLASSSPHGAILAYMLNDFIIVKFAVHVLCKVLQAPSYVFLMTQLSTIFDQLVRKR